MGKVIFDMSVSLDGFVGAADGEDRGLHHWVFGGSVPLAIAGTTFQLASEKSAQVFRELIEGSGAAIVGRGTFSGFNEEPPFQLPCFVLTHHTRTSTVKDGVPVTFVIDGIESALHQAQAAAGDKAVYVFGGVNVVQQYLKAGLIDELQINVVPVLFGEGLRLFENLGTQPIELESTRVVESVGVTHLKFRFVK